MEQPNTLNDIYQANPGAFMQAQGMLGRQATAADLTNQQSAQDLQFQAQNQPFKLAGLGLENQTKQAQLPGVQADSATKVRNEANASLLNPQLLNSLRGKYSSEEIKRHAEDLDNVGQIFRQGSSTVFDNPMGAGVNVKAALTKAGKGDLWNPSWDSLPASSLQLVLNDVGTNIGNAATEYRTKMNEQGLKNTGTETTAKIGAASREEVADLQAKAKVEAAFTKAVTSAKDQYAALANKAMGMPEGPEKEQVKAQAQAAANMASHMAEVAAQARNEPGINIPGATNLPANPKAPVPNVVAPPMATRPTGAAGPNTAGPPAADGTPTVLLYKNGRTFAIPRDEVATAVDKYGYKQQP